MLGEDTKRPFKAYQDANRLLVGGMVAGLLAPLVFALQAGASAQLIGVAAVGIAASAATLMFGAVIGFIFGIPKSLQEGTAPQEPQNGALTGAERRAPYAGNTSLEQISDWLTKIIVGVGLTQLVNVPAAFSTIGKVLGDGLGNLPGAETFAVGLVVYCLFDGFFIGYLWTRLFLPGLFAESDARSIVERARDDGRVEGEQLAVEAAANAQRPYSQVAPESEGIHGLWVDDRPPNNDSERRWISGILGVDWTNVTSTDQAMGELASNPDKYQFVITDMGRPGDPRAGYALLRQMRDAGIVTPVIIYAGSSAPEHDAEAKAAGALGSTNSPSELLNLINRAIGERRAQPA